MKRKIENVLEITIPLSLGFFVRSLLVESDDNWKLILCILLTLMTLQRIFDKYNK